MELDRLINYIDGKLENQFPKNIIVPEFTFNRVICKNVDFIFMGVAVSKENLGKAIYISKDCLPDVQIPMNDLLVGSDNKDVGTGDIGIAASESLDKEVFNIVGKHLQYYVRKYDDKVHKEKVFFPLECEVFGESKYSEDATILSNYPQWDGFKESEDSKIKCIDYQQEKGKPWFWWLANRAWYDVSFCVVFNNSGIGEQDSDAKYIGVGLAFCL